MFIKARLLLVELLHDSSMFRVSVELGIYYIVAVPIPRPSPQPVIQNTHRAKGKRNPVRIFPAGKPSAAVLLAQPPTMNQGLRQGVRTLSWTRVLPPRARQGTTRGIQIRAVPSEHLNGDHHLPVAGTPNSAQSPGMFTS